MSTTEKIQMKLSDSVSARWTALFIVSVTMMFGYFFTDVMSPLEPLLTAAKGAENGLILDKFGIRFTGVLSTVLMFGGALLKWYAVGHEFAGSVAVPFFGTYSTQVVIAALGFAIYGVGCEICGITVSKVIVKWFTGHFSSFCQGNGRCICFCCFGCSFALCRSLGLFGLLRDGQEGGCFSCCCSY